MSEGSSGVTSGDTEEESIFLMCGVCRKPPANSSTAPAPKLLPCLHSFCFKCLEERFALQQQQQQQRQEQSTSGLPSSSHHRLKCPTCGQEFLVPPKGLGGFLDNQFLLENLGKGIRSEGIQNRVCTSCEDNSPATSYCLNCTDWLCDACVQAHQRVRVTKDHQIQSEEDYRASECVKQQKPMFCQVHSQEPLKLFCATCERLTCRDCQLLEHKDHKYQFITEAALGYRDFVKSQLNRLYEQAQPLTDSIREVDKATRGLHEREEGIADEIHKASETIIKAVKQREGVLIAELNALVHFKHKLLAKQSKDLKLMQKILQHNYGFTRHVLKNSSDMALLYSRKQLSSRIQNLLSLKYKVNPVTHSDLRCSIDTDKFCHVIGKLGTVITPSDKSVTGTSRAEYRMPGAPSVQTTAAYTVASHKSATTTAVSQPTALETLTSGNKHIFFKRSGVLNNYLTSRNFSGGPRVVTIPSASMTHPSGGTISISTKYAVSPMSSNSKPLGVTRSLSSAPPLRNTATISTPIDTGNRSTIPLRHFQNGIASLTKSSPPPRPASTGSSGGSHHSLSPVQQPGHNGWNSPESLVRNEVGTPSKQDKVLKLNPEVVATVAEAVAAAAADRDIKIPKLLHIKRSNSCNGISLTSPPEVKIKQEKLDSPEESLPYKSLQKPQQEDTASGESGIDDASTNEDWCAVCRNGGELLCCDTCPRVFHLVCHVPALSGTPSDRWSCGLCQNIDVKLLQDQAEAVLIANAGNKRRSSTTGLPEWERKVCEKIVLEVFCHPDSLPFQQKVSKSVPNYYKVISHPMDLTNIRAKLQPQHFQHYTDLNEFASDLRLLFFNCATFNDESSEVGQMGRRLEEFFNGLLKQNFPNFVEPPTEPPPKRRKEDAKMFIQGM